jgi:hypothetical protein
MYIELDKSPEMFLVTPLESAASSIRSIRQ